MNPLAPYVQHLADCKRWDLDKSTPYPHKIVEVCTCGLYQALEAQEAVGMTDEEIERIVDSVETDLRIVHGNARFDPNTFAIECLRYLRDQGCRLPVGEPVAWIFKCDSGPVDGIVAWGPPNSPYWKGWTAEPLYRLPKGRASDGGGVCQGKAECPREQARRFGVPLPVECTCKGAPASQSLAVPCSAVSAPSSQDAAAPGGAPAHNPPNNPSDG